MLRPDDVSVHLRPLLRFCARGLDASCSFTRSWDLRKTAFLLCAFSRCALLLQRASGDLLHIPLSPFECAERPMTPIEIHFLDEHAWPLTCGIRRCEKEGENVLKFPGNVTALEAPSLPLLCLAFASFTRRYRCVLTDPRCAREVVVWYSYPVTCGFALDGAQDAVTSSRGELGKVDRGDALRLLRGARSSSRTCGATL